MSNLNLIKEKMSEMVLFTENKFSVDMNDLSENSIIYNNHPYEFGWLKTALDDSMSFEIFKRLKLQNRKTNANRKPHFSGISDNTTEEEKVLIKKLFANTLDDMGRKAEFSVKIFDEKSKVKTEKKLPPKQESKTDTKQETKITDTQTVKQDEKQETKTDTKTDIKTTEEAKKIILNLAKMYDVPIEFPNEKPKTKKDEKQVYHYLYDSVMSLLDCGLCPYLYGAMGTGKSHLAEQIAEAKGLKCYVMSSIQDITEMTGYRDAKGDYVSTPFYEVCKKGGVFLLDEADSSNPQALVAINNALAQWHFTFCGEDVKINRDNTYFIASGNTTGRDANNGIYTGRSCIDLSSLDRYYPLEFGYDKHLDVLRFKAEIVEFVWKTREILHNRNIEIPFSPRTMERIEKVEALNNELLNPCADYLARLNKDELNILIDGLETIGGFEKYVKWLKKGIK